MIMDWEMLLALAGIYILLIGIFFHHWLVSKRMMALDRENIETSKTNRRILESVRAIETYILEGIYKKEDEKK